MIVGVPSTAFMGRVLRNSHLKDLGVADQGLYGFRVEGFRIMVWGRHLGYLMFFLMFLIGDHIHIIQRVLAANPGVQDHAIGCCPT